MQFIYTIGSIGSDYYMKYFEIKNNVVILNDLDNFVSLFRNNMKHKSFIKITAQHSNNQFEKNLEYGPKEFDTARSILKETVNCFCNICNSKLPASNYGVSDKDEKSDDRNYFKFDEKRFILKNISIDVLFVNYKNYISELLAYYKNNTNSSLNIVIYDETKEETKEEIDDEVGDGIENQIEDDVGDDTGKETEDEMSLNEIDNPYSIHLPKPFIILAGISGTGKTKIIRDLAGIDNKSNINNYHLEPVRPDWHEPSDLFGYISRIGSEPEFIMTGFLQFVVDAWKHIFDCLNHNLTNTTDSISPILPSNLRKLQEIDPSILENIQTYWLCLDEMNLAPVELYLADYLSILETRNWKYEYDRKSGNPIKFSYSCDPLVKSQVFKILSNSAKDKLKNELFGSLKNNVQSQKISDNFTEANNINVSNKLISVYEPLFEDFLENGIPLPFNLVVVGTVNMDETTHGFSRKVLDRALSYDFTEFFPNNFDDYWKEFQVDSNEGQEKIEETQENEISDCYITESIENNSPGSKLNLAYSNHSYGVDFGTSLIYRNNLLSIPTLNTINDATTSSPKSEKFLIEFLKNINEYALKDTPFELGFRALNELFLYVLSFGKISEIIENNFETYLSILNENTKKFKTIISKTILLSILDDFVLAKILPRIEGDIDKLVSVANGKICERKNENDEDLLGSMEILNSVHSNNDEKNYEKFDFDVKNNDSFELSVLHDLALVLIYQFELIFDKNIYIDKLNSNDPKQFIKDLSKVKNYFVRYDLFKLLMEFDSFKDIFENQIKSFSASNNTSDDLNNEFENPTLTNQEIYNDLKNNFSIFTIPSRSLKKICWMLEKLEKTSYTGFWR